MNIQGRTIKRMLSIKLLLVMLLIPVASCSKKSGGGGSSSSAATNTSSSVNFPDKFNVSGKLNLADDTQKQVGAVDFSNKPVALVDSTGAVITQGTATKTGAFTLALSTSGLNLTNTNSPTSQVHIYQIKSLFLAGQSNDAVGTQEQVVLDPRNVQTTATGSDPSLDLGSFTTQKVGAIVGSITLETKEDPTGIDVYIPGTSYIAKTDGSGNFILGFLPAGTYNLRADKNGFGSAEWANIEVQRNATSNIDTVVLRISTGPKIVSFGLDSGNTFSTNATVNFVLKTSGASKFRISQLSDFRDTVYRVIDASKDQMTIPFQISGQDGTQRIYIDVADSNGLSVASNIDLLLATHLPVAPSYTLRATGPEANYTNTTSPTFSITDCGNVDKVFITDSSTTTPKITDFTTECSDALANGLTFTPSNGDGVKSIYLWASDKASQVSASGKLLAIKIDTVAPTLNMTPAPESGQSSVLSNEAIEIVLTPSETSFVHYTFDLSQPTSNSPVIDTTSGSGRLVIIGNATLKALAIDSAGNVSTVISRDFVINRDGPILGTIAVTGGLSLLNTITIPLTISAQRATKMRIAESIAGLQTGNWLTYATSKTYTLQQTSDGVKTLYVLFGDDAGNTLGEGGEFFTTFTLDRTPPADGNIILLPPESPTGAFNTPLVWSSTYLDEDNVHFIVEVHSTSNYASAIRTINTTDTSINISPPLATEGVYYWRVKAVDQAENSSAWVTSGDTKSFKLRILAQAFQQRKDFYGDSSTDQIFGKEMILGKDYVGNGTKDIIYSIIQTNTSDSDGNSCQGCGAVQIVDPSTGNIITTLSENLPRSAAYGHKIQLCDLNGDGVDEIIVSATAKAVKVGDITYQQAGAIYVYDPQQNFQLIATKEADLTGTNPAPGYYYCQTWGLSGCEQYGWEYWPNQVDYLSYGNTSSRFFGWDLTCVRHSSGNTANSQKDEVVVTEPNYNDGSNSIGRAIQLQYDGTTTLVQTHQLLGPTANDSYGGATKFLSSFKYGGCSTGPTLVVSAPTKIANGDVRGGAYLYQMTSGAWTLCDTIDAPGTDPSYENFGQRLSDLGDVQKDGFRELAISTVYWGGGSVRIYGGSTGAQLKSYKDTSYNNSYLGYQVVTVGDFNNDSVGDIAISAPQAQINGQWGAGVVYIFSYASLNNSDDTSATILKTIIGTPESGANLGAGVVPVLETSSIHSANKGLYLSKPGRSSNGSWGVGSFHFFDTIKMAPTLPYKIAGTSSNAKFGHSIVSIPDVDNDSVADFLIGQPGGVCDGKPYGAVSIFSVLDQRINSSVCTDYSGNSLGINVGYFPTANYIYFAKKGVVYSVYPGNILNYLDVDDNNKYPTSPSHASYGLGYTTSFISPPYSTSGGQGSFDEILISDPTAWNSGSNSGQVYLTKHDNQFSQQCIYRGQTGYQFGTSTSFISDINGDSTRDFVIGAPGEDVTGATGRVYLIDGTRTGGNACAQSSGSPVSFDITPSASNVIISIPANDPVITSGIGRKAYSGFGSFVLGLPKYDTGSSKAYLYVANTNIANGSSTVIPEYFIFRINADNSITLMRHQTGVAGGMLGGYAKLLTDIDGDGYPEIAISYPGGQGRLGATGQVQIISGGSLASNSSDNDLLQTLFNPDQQAGNFGVSFEYGDITGDSIKDFVVGSDLYNNGIYQKAGAIYVYPIHPIKD